MTEEDSEKRFHSVMDKLFSSPKPKSISRNQSSRGEKRGNSVLSGGPNGEINDSRRNLFATSGLDRALVPARSTSSSSTKAPLCRPWDRTDLMKRLATFKSMTWFGKPKVVSAVNCARRGWINVEMDIIACEACGARLLFSNPSSWSQQQIEKAAAVFSLKLDNGHKHLCPWIDNSCDESLAQFPPTPSPALIDGYRQRASALLQLSALPIVSSSAVDYMRCPQLEHFLEQSSLSFGIGFVNISTTEGPEHEGGDSANLYYKAQKLISLCGWEPRALAYTVDCHDRSSQNGHSEEMSPQVANVGNTGVVMYSKPGVDYVKDLEEDPASLNVLQSDPASVVLDCKLCGATAGLWAFSTAPRPLEWFRIDESLEVNGQNDSGNRDANVVENGGTMGSTSTKERGLSLNMSIAGGPPPEKQSYRATVSLPIISRHLRATLSSKSDARNPASSVTNSLEQEDTYTTPCKLLGQAEDKRPFTQRVHEDGLGVCLNGNGSTAFVDSSQKRLLISGKDDDKFINNGNKEAGVESGSQGEVGDAISQDSNDSRKPNGNDPQPSIAQLDEVISEATQAAVSVSSSPEANMVVDIACTTNLQEHDVDSHQPKTLDPEGTSEKVNHITNSTQLTVNKGNTSNGKVDRVNNTAQLPINKENGAASAQGSVKDLNRAQLEFDPIRQHRHFCPWIVSTGKSGPGWRLTLSALDHEKASSPSSSMFEGDEDPITSVRNLFKSPPTKRLKISRHT